MNNKTQQVLFRALYRLLRPMVRLLMRHGVSYRLFADVARHVYVDVAEEDFALPGRKPSNARIAVLTGINRKDIAKLKERPHPLADGTIDNPTPCSRIITAWINHARFHDPDGQPLELLIDDDPAEPNFTELVRDFSSDVPVRAILDELERMGAVVKHDGRVRLVVQAYVPQEDLAENIRIFGTAAADLMGTMDYNIAKLGTAFIQRTVSYDDIPVELLDRIRQRSRTDGEAFLLQVNDWLADCDREQTPSLIGSGRARAGIGIYYFEQLANEESQEVKK
jgi:hypothetical protein